MSVNVNPALLGLLNYAEEKGLIEACDRTYCHNRLLQMLQLDAPDEVEKALEAPLAELLGILTDSAVERGLIADGVVSRDLLDSLLMEAVTPFPHEVRRTFAGTIQAFVPLNRVDAFCAEMDRLLGAKSCHRLSIRPVGGVLLEVLE